LQRLINACDAELVVTSPSLYDIACAAAAAAGSIPLATLESLDKEPATGVTVNPSHEDEPAYIQFTSGSTRFPKGVVLTQRAVMKNLQGIGYGLQVGPTDRCVSWLPFYHDMGLVGFVLGPLTSQLSVDFLPSYEYAKRPLEWLRLISRNGGTIAFSPLLGYELCARRLASYDATQLDLSSWRVAGVGAEMIHRQPLERFAERLQPAGFSNKAFLPCYGLAEVTLAVTFGDLSAEVSTEMVAPPDEPDRLKEFVNCGHPLPDLELAIRDEHGNDVPPGTIGRILVRGPSVMTGYFNDSEASRNVLSTDGWLDTGDLGLMTDNGLVITGRSKELIIINGRNLWPQDLEAIAEDEPQVRFGDALAFAADAPDGNVTVVLMVQNRLIDESAREELVNRLQGRVYQALGVNCRVILVPPHTLPRTSSGKMSRTRAREIFLERMGWIPASTNTAPAATSESRAVSGG
jgi:fatty-acyl-CoA synthase